MEHINTVVVATDFSPGSDAAVAQAVRLAHAAGAKLHAVHAITSRMMADARQAENKDDRPSADSVIDAARDRVEAALANAGASGCSVHISPGKAINEIRDVVEQTSANLLVIGATGASGIRFGTVAGRCVRATKVDVLLVPPEHTNPFARIVACVDLGDSTQGVLQAAAAFAKLDRSTLIAAHAFEVPWERARWGGAPSDGVQQFEAFEQAKRDQLVAITHATEQATNYAIRAEVIANVDAEQAISGYANEIEADLVVTGRTDRSKLGYMLLGTTAEKVLRDTRGAVLAVHHDA